MMKTYEMVFDPPVVEQSFNNTSESRFGQCFPTSLLKMSSQ